MEKDPGEELYDLNQDRDQMNNLAANSKYTEIVKKLRKRLINYLRKTNDPRLIEDGKFFETPPMAGQPKGQYTIEQAIAD